MFFARGKFQGKVIVPSDTKIKRSLIVSRPFDTSPTCQIVKFLERRIFPKKQKTLNSQFLENHNTDIVN